MPSYPTKNSLGKILDSLRTIMKLRAVISTEYRIVNSMGLKGTYEQQSETIANLPIILYCHFVQQHCVVPVACTGYRVHCSKSPCLLLWQLPSTSPPPPESMTSCLWDILSSASSPPGHSELWLRKVLLFFQYNRGLGQHCGRNVTHSAAFLKWGSSPQPQGQMKMDNKCQPCPRSVPESNIIMFSSCHICPARRRVNFPLAT